MLCYGLLDMPSCLNDRYDKLDIKNILFSTRLVALVLETLVYEVGDMDRAKKLKDVVIHWHFQHYKDMSDFLHQALNIDPNSQMHCSIDRVKECMVHQRQMQSSISCVQAKVAEFLLKLDADM